MLLDALLDWLFSELFASFSVIHICLSPTSHECDFYMYISETSVICRVLVLSFCFLDLSVKQLNLQIIQ